MDNESKCGKVALIFTDDGQVICPICGIIRVEHYPTGDVFIHNDPYPGGSHLPDVNVVAPAFLDDRLLGFGFGAVEQITGRRLGETHQNVVALQLEALAVGRFDLQGGVVVGQDGAGLEGTVLFEEQIHGLARVC